MHTERGDLTTLTAHEKKTYSIIKIMSCPMEN